MTSIFKGAPMTSRVQFKLVIKQGLKSIVELNGREIPLENISLSDLGRVIEAEKLLERIFGYRFHILTVSFEEKGEGGATKK